MDKVIRGTLQEAQYNERARTQARSNVPVGYTLGARYYYKLHGLDFDVGVPLIEGCEDHDFPKEQCSECIFETELSLEED